MGETLPPLPTRPPRNRAMAAALRYWHSSRARDRSLLERVARGLRALPDDYPSSHCRSTVPIRGHAHAQQLMAIHARHRCDRYTDAVRFVGAVTT
ncbi:hypothetical protein [Nocardia testacea]|uniref:hypothetical protein n=1 Tax=Nocardia testacea TaxID=248551 RepID=UPI000585A418|nr:hypothetical protein [Nocardia testacea]